MYEEYYNELPIYNIPTVYSPLAMSMDPMLNKGLLFDVLLNYTRYEPNYIIHIITRSIDDILKDIFSSDGKRLLELFRDKEFVKLFTKAAEMIEINDSRRLKINKITYDYIVHECNDNDMKATYFALSSVVNRVTVGILIGINLPDSIAEYIALARYSCDDEVVNIKRVNFIIMCSGADVMSEQMIITIYEKLFDHLIPMFKAIMLDYIDPDDDGMSEDNWKVYSNISLALLDIVENIPRGTIIDLLREFYDTYMMCYGKNKLRFNLYGISTDYEKIHYALGYMHNVLGYDF